jgi:hypothetical protein
MASKSRAMARRVCVGGASACTEISASQPASMRTRKTTPALIEPRAREELGGRGLPLVDGDD